MPRTVDDAPLTTKAARERLPVRHKPYWRRLDAGAALGYRKGKAGGSWLVRIADPAAGGGYRQASIGRADDALKATGDKVLDFRQAEIKARDWIARRHRIATGLEEEPSAPPPKPYTVAAAMADYLADFAARGGKGVAQTRTTANAHIIPALGAEVVSRLTRERVKNWHRALAAAPARVRARQGRVQHGAVQTDPDAQRRRRATANRILTVLKAALNHAIAEGKAKAAEAWTAVKPFRKADKATVRYLLEDEVRRLISACPGDFRNLATAALLTGCRYGELAAMLVSDFDPIAGVVSVARSKGGAPRHVVLTDEGRVFFTRQSEGKVSIGRMFERDLQMHPATRTAKARTQRSPWGKSHQFRLLREACAAADITPAVSFHILRHTYASRLAQRGAPMPVIAAQLGHTDTRMTERHYAHLGPSYVADIVRQTFGTLGLAVPGDGEPN